MPYILQAKCGKKGCKAVANSYEEIEEKFGWRIVGGRKIPQSYCREHRKKKIDKSS